jgi:hypothetical protein
MPRWTARGRTGASIHRIPSRGQVWRRLSFAPVGGLISRATEPIFPGRLGQGPRHATVELAPLRGTPTQGASGHPVCAFADGVVPGQRLLLEYRGRDGWDQGMPPVFRFVHGSISELGTGWVVAHLTGPEDRSRTSLQIGLVEAAPGASIETSKGGFC